VDQREQHRVAVHYRLIVRHAGIEGPGVTENLSERGGMLSVDIDPPLSPGDLVELDFDVPGLGPITVGAHVRWASSVLPGMTGVEFTLPVRSELLAHIAKLVLAGVARAQGF
jgi:hypothetical protein